MCNNRERIRYHTASFTVEASFIMPMVLMVLFFFMNFFSLIQFEQKMQSSINETARNLAKSAYLYENLVDDIALTKNETLIKVADQFDVNEKVTSVLYYNKLLQNMKQNKMNLRHIKRGRQGIQVITHQDYYADDCVDFSVVYSFCMPIRIFPVNYIRCSQRTHMINWTGFEVEKKYSCKESEEDKDEDYVYVTETGKRYHRYEDCSYIKIEVFDSTCEDIKYIRNQYNKAYAPCSLCADIKKGISGDTTVYYTKSGNRYHRNRNCHAIKRSVKKVKKSEVEGTMSCCSRCKKREEVSN